MADGFLGRWSRRKQELRESKPLAAEAAPSVAQPPHPHSGTHTDDVLAAPPSRTPNVSPPADGTGHPADTPSPSLADVTALTPASDFKPFVAQGVAPEVKNAAMKKLFADPHYNVMDGLDIYIDDYSQPDPLPASMLRKMAGAQFLNLFDDPKSGQPAAPGQENPPSTAQPASPGAPPEPSPLASPDLPPENHAHTDLQLQPNHAAGSPSPGRGTQ